MSFTVKGKVLNLLPIQSGTSARGEWKKQEFVIETQEQYPKNICFTLFGDDKINLINGLEIGAEIEVSFNVESREYNERWYHNINAWRVNKVVRGEAEEPPPPFSEADIPPASATGAEEDASADNDLPF